MDIRIRLNSQEDTYKLAKILSEYVFPGMIIGLSGDLGSGKTTFTKYLAKEIGVIDVLNSPTFTILKTYKGNFDLYHMDVYRLEGIGYDYELDDFIYGKGIAVIEWCEYIEVMLPEDIIKLSFKFVDEQIRDVLIKGSGKYEKIVEKISDRYSN
ncbi:MAG: tRNA (adenosine(37)-N6)-threonylcarbamoyltransferase complex ATPase subunit type 1 TsaE [Candidatus Izimaplasma sp.]|nr:tRNA (adenosine(37)-N6)-threonylcarbamoyltransferase complex ATPase subunit type 1 TsaE [Candidatus Izimaplasma bacterium]